MHRYKKLANFQLLKKGMTFTKLSPTGETRTFDSLYIKT